MSILFGNSARKMVRDQCQTMGLVIPQKTYAHRPNVDLERGFQPLTRAKRV